MPRFAYRSAGGGGGGVIEAPDRSSALREVMRRGEVPASMEEVAGASRNGPAQLEHSGGGHASGAASGSTNEGSRGIEFGSIMSLPELAYFMRELATALRAGLPLIQALKTIAKQGRKQRQKAMLSSIIDQVEHGKSLSDAFATQGPPFTELVINLTRAGEASGKLGEVLAHSADLLDKDVKLRRSLMAATLYPAIIAVLVIGAVIVVTTFIVPSILKQVAAQAATLPWPTRVLQESASFFASWWWLVLLILAAVFISFQKYYATAAGRLSVDTFLLKTPLVGTLMREVAVARFTRTLATLTSSGIPVVTGLRITKGVLGNRAMEQVIETVIEQVSAGRTIAQPMEESGYFPPMLVQIVNMGERSGRLEELLGQAAHAFEEKTEQAVKLFTAALPPILIMFLAGLVGFIVLAILMALLSMQDAAMRG